MLPYICLIKIRMPFHIVHTARPVGFCVFLKRHQAVQEFLLRSITVPFIRCYARHLVQRNPHALLKGALNPQTLIQRPCDQTRDQHDPKAAQEKCFLFPPVPLIQQHEKPCTHGCKEKNIKPVIAAEAQDQTEYAVCCKEPGRIQLFISTENRLMQKQAERRQRDRKNSVLPHTDCMDGKYRAQRVKGRCKTAQQGADASPSQPADDKSQKHADIEHLRRGIKRAAKIHGTEPVSHCQAQLDKHRIGNRMMIGKSLFPKRLADRI